MTPTQALLDRLELLLQDTDFIRNLLYRLIACFNLYGVKCLIRMDSCHAYSPSNIAFCVSAILFQPSPVTYSAPASSLSSGILSGYFPSVRMSYKYLLSRIISSRISCQSGIGVRAIRMTARIAPTNAAAPTTANTFFRASSSLPCRSAQRKPCRQPQPQVQCPAYPIAKIVHIGFSCVHHLLFVKPKVSH